MPKSKSAKTKQMIKLKPVLSVKELPPCYAKLRQGFPSLREFISEEAHEYEPKLLDYLQQGVLCGVYLDRGLAYDVLQPGKKIDKRFIGDGDESTETTAKRQLIQASGLMTDGVWIWPGALIYYLENYHLQINPDFLRHAENQNWTIHPAEIDIKNLNTEAFDRPENF